MYPMAPDFRFPARRDHPRMASHVRAGVTKQGDEKTSQRGHLLTEIALSKRHRSSDRPGHCPLAESRLRQLLHIRVRTLNMPTDEESSFLMSDSAKAIKRIAR